MKEYSNKCMYCYYANDTGEKDISNGVCSECKPPVSLFEEAKASVICARKWRWEAEHGVIYKD